MPKKAASEASKASSKAPLTALVTFDDTKPITIYECIDPDTNIVFYVGRTVDLHRRAGEHDRSKYKIREFLKLKNYRFREVVRPVPELPHGCHASDAPELESYFIFERKSLYDPVNNPLGCNARLGDHATEMSPQRFAELTEMFATTGYQWPEEECAPPEAVSEDLASARGVETVIGELLEDARTDGDEEAVEALEAHFALAKVERFAIEKAYYSVRGFAELVLRGYKDTYVDAVDLHTLSSELNAVKDKLKDDPEYEDLAGVINAMGHVASLDKNRTVSSTAAAAGLEMVIAIIATREEEHLTWTKTGTTGRHPPYGVRDNIYAVRQWTKSNGMKKPSLKGAATEKSLGYFLTDWKAPSAKTYGGECTDLKSCDVVMRDVPWWDAFVDWGAKNKDDWKKLNTQLLEGYAWKDEPPFDGKKTILYGGGNKSVYDKLLNLVHNGGGAEADVETALAGLPEVRADWYRKQYESNRKNGLDKMKAGDEERKAKRKREAEGSSTDPLPDEESME